MSQLSHDDIESEAGSNDQQQISIYPHADNLRNASQMLDELPIDHRAVFAEYFASALGAIQQRDILLRNQGLSAVCDGSCRERDGELGARTFLYSIADPDEQNFLEETIVPSQVRDFNDVSTLSDAVHAALAHTSSGVQVDGLEDPTLSDVILARVRAQEHSGHQVGTRMTRKAGFSAARLMFFRVVILVQIMSFALPAEAHSCQSQVSDDGNVTLYCEYDAIWNHALGGWFASYTVPVDVSIQSCVFYNSTCVAHNGDLPLSSKLYCDYYLQDCQMQVYGARLSSASQALLRMMKDALLRMVSVAGYCLGYIFNLLAHLLFAVGCLVLLCLRSQFNSIIAPLTDQLLNRIDESKEMVVYDDFTLSMRLYLRICISIVVGALYLIFLYYAIHLIRRTCRTVVNSIKWRYDRVISWLDVIGGRITPNIGDFVKNSALNLHIRTSMIQPEMAQDGSVFSDMKVNKALLSICTRNYKNEFSHVGFAFRHKDYLLTAMHVVEMIINQQVDVYLAPCKEKDGCTVVDTMSMQLWQPGYEKNIVPDDSDDGINLSSCYDCYIEPIGNKFFSTLGVSSLKLAYSTFNCNARTFGYFKPTVKAALGVICKSEEQGFVHYTASTRDGSSGSPVVSGSSFMAMHLGVADNGRNRGLSTAVIEIFINNYENILPEVTPDFHVDKVTGQVRDFKGKNVEVRMYAGGATIYDPKTGRERAVRRDVYEQLLDYERHIDIGRGYRIPEYGNLEVDTMEKLDPYYDDSCSTSPLAKPLVPPNSPHRRLLQLSENTILKISDERRKAVRPPTFAGYVPETEKVLDLVGAARIGYDLEKFAFPETANPVAMVTESFTKHVEVFVSAVKNAVIPDLDIQNRAYRIVMKQLENVTYLLPREPLSRDNILSILHSSLIKNNKSPGRRFMVDGLMSNEAVFNRYTDDEIVAMVQAEEPPQDINVFPKLDPHKRSKIDSGMIRCISGVDLIEQIRAHAYFNALNTSIATNWKTSPIKVGFSPIQPKSGEFFFNMFQGSSKKYKWMEDDTSTWDWRCLEFVIHLVCKIAVQLGKRPKDMSEEEAKKIREEAYNIAIRQFMFPFVLPDGTVIHRLKPNIMTSGSVITLIFNSIAMLVLDAMAKLEMGFSVEEILKNFVLCVGGDDKLQRVPKDFDHELYISLLNRKGLKIHEAKIHDVVDGIEFFSWCFSRSKDRAKEITWIPTRFTRHVHNLRATPYKDLKDALISHAYNWAHDKEKFEYFRSVFERCSEKDPEVFELRRFPDRQQLINYFYGFESSLDCYSNPSVV